MSNIKRNDSSNCNLWEKSSKSRNIKYQTWSVANLNCSALAWDDLRYFIVSLILWMWGDNTPRPSWTIKFKMWQAHLWWNIFPLTGRDDFYKLKTVSTNTPSHRGGEDNEDSRIGFFLSFYRRPLSLSHSQSPNPAQFPPFPSPFAFSLSSTRVSTVDLTSDSESLAAVDVCDGHYVFGSPSPSLYRQRPTIRQRSYVYDL